MADALRALAVAYRRARRFDEAARCWSALLESGCSSGVEREAIEALAIHHEHRLRDLESARLFALKNLAARAWRGSGGRTPRGAASHESNGSSARRHARANC